MKNISDVSTIDIAGGHWHAQPGQVGVLSVVPGNIAMRLRVVPVAAPPAMPLGAFTATAKQAPQSRGSSAHT